MSVWTAIVAIVAIIGWVEVRKARYQSGQAPDRALHDDTPRGFTPPSHREGELEREVIELRKRLEVLERIATDDRKSRDLAEEIDRLR